LEEKKTIKVCNDHIKEFSNEVLGLIG